MTNMPIDQFTFWIFLITGFMLVWSFRYFTDSKKQGDFEFLGLGIFCGFINLMIFSFLMKFSYAKFPTNDNPLVEMYAAGLILSIVSISLGLLAAQISKWKWFRSLMNRLKSNWFA